LLLGPAQARLDQTLGAFQDSPVLQLPRQLFHFALQTQSGCDRANQRADGPAEAQQKRQLSRLQGKPARATHIEHANNLSGIEQ
jgi:hypothetical protein